jgi:hypothetical protein
MWPDCEDDLVHGIRDKALEVCDKAQPQDAGE